MNRTGNKNIEKLKEYKKEEILKALKHAYPHYPFHADLLLKLMVDYLENKPTQKVDTVIEALEEEKAARAEYAKYCNEMVEKYGDGKSCYMRDMSEDDLARGAELESRIHEAIKKRGY